MQHTSHKMALFLVLGLSTITAFAEEDSSAPTATLSGSFGIVNKYIYRGGIENNDVTLQAGLEYAYNPHFSVGYWGSTLDYDASDSSEDKDHGFEHDFYLAYAGQINPDWRYKLQTTAYYYQDGGSVYAENGDKRRTTAVDVLGELGYKNLTLAAVVILNDASFANAGDLYFSAAYSHDLVQDFILNSSIGVSIYNSNRDDSIISTQKHVAFNEARMGVSKEIAHTPATVFFDYVIGGQDRLAEHFDDQWVLGLNFDF